MGKKLCCIVGLSCLMLFAFAASASAITLGITAQPNGSTESVCPASTTIAQLTQDPTSPYFVPAGGGTITQWQTLTAADNPGDPVEFVVLRPAGTGSYMVVGSDSETIPNPLPAGGVASYSLATPIVVAGGETLGLFSSGGGVGCFFQAGSTPSGDSLVALGDGSPPPSAGQTLTQTGPTSGAGFTMNLAATLIQNQDAGVTTTAGPAGAAAGRPALLSSTVTNGGPDSGTLTFVDQVPGGLAINSAVAGDGTCSTSGQTVTCTISGLTAGQSVPVDVVVTPNAAGNYSNSVSVAIGSGLTDPNAANNAASAVLAVGPPVSVAPAQKCIVPKLTNTPSGVARAVLNDLGCTVRITRAHSQTLRRGFVIRSRPGRGTYAYQKTITLVTSSGPIKHKAHHKHAPRSAE
ncbi:MAG: hypothetical protein JO147_15240 [Actinobacteria bacterium]|nr:hypothetical protein [Actinomycetota bacterium]